MIHSQKKSRQRPQQSFLGEIARYKLPIPGVTLVYYYETACRRLPLNMVTAVRKTQAFYVTLVKPDGNTG